MLYYKGLYILEETDKYSYVHPSTIEKFDRNDKVYVAFSIDLNMYKQFFKN